MIPYEIISTGSKGNAVVLDNCILVDCGVPFRAVRPHIGDLKLILLTHSHGDHLNKSTVRRLASERPLLRFACGKWLAPVLLLAGVQARQIDVLECDTSYDYGFARVKSFELTHDVPNCGWKIETANGKVLYATDTCSMNGIEAPNYDLYLLEANYEEEEILERMEDKKAAGEFSYERRVMKTHLSREKADNWLYTQMSPKSTYVYMHCHEEE